MGAAERVGFTLSKREMAELTHTPFKKLQVAFLRRNGIRHYLDAHDWPVVLRSTVEGDVSGELTAAKPWKSNKVA